MRRPLLPFTAIAVFMLLLMGCALPVDSDAPRPLEREAFAARMDRLEENLAARCEREQWQSEEEMRQLLRLDEGLQEVSSLVRYLRSDLQRLQQVEAQPVVECAAEGLDLGDKIVVGRAEWIGLTNIGTYLKARIDSGANTSSLSAKDITYFERDGENWVRFKLGLTEEDVAVEEVRDQWIERPVVRRVRIIQASGDESRPVISLMMTLGPIQESVEFTLNDRSHLTYPVLLGRRFLMDIAVIDVAELYLHERPFFPGGRPPEEAELDETDDLGDDED